MYGKYKKSMSHAGLAKVRLLCSINITQLVVADSATIQQGSVLSICFEKGGKISTSNEIIYDVSKNKVNPLRTNANLKHVTISIDERVELVMTLYKNQTTGKYEEKNAKIILRQLKRHAGLGMDAFKSIGVCLLQLHELVHGADHTKSVTKDCTLHLEDLPGCSLSALVHIKFIQPRRSVFGVRHSASGVALHGNVQEEGDSADEGDDAVSVGSTVSAGSAFSTLGATFYYNDLDEYYGAGEGIVGLSGDVHTGISDSYTFGKPSAPIPEIEPQAVRNNNSPFVVSPQRRYSGVVEAVHQAEKKPIRSFLSRKSSHIGTGSRSDLSAFAILSDSEFLDSARSPPMSPTPDQSENCLVTPAKFHESSLPAGIQPPEVFIQQGATDFVIAEGSTRQDPSTVDQVEKRHPAAVRVSGGEWASVTSAERDRTNSHGSPIRLSSPKALHTRTASTDTSSRSPQHRNNHPHRTPSNASSSSSHVAHSPAGTSGLLRMQLTERVTSPPASPRAAYDNAETFALLEKELELRGERIAALEAKLELQELQHRAEMLIVRTELHAAQAEVKIFSQAPPAPAESPLRAVPPKQVPQIADVGTQHEIFHEEFPFSVADAIHAVNELHLNDAHKEEEDLLHQRRRDDDLQEPEAPLSQLHHQEILDTENVEISEMPVAKNYTTTHSQTHSEAVTSRGCQTELLLESEVVSTVPTESSNNAESKETHETEMESSPAAVPSSAITALLSEYGRSAAQVQLLASDLVYYKQQAEEALRAKAEETLAAREAATVAVQACMRRADCEQELEESVYQLRELQRKHARLSIEYEAEVKRCYSLKARLQLYAQKLSALEVDYTLSLEEAAATSVDGL